MMQTFKTRLQEKLALSPSVYLFRFALNEPKQLDFTAGQYLVLSISQSNGETLKRLYSIASPSSENNSFQLLVRLLDGGIASEYFKNLNQKDIVTFQGPAGGFTLNNNERHKVFVATGTGLSPIRSMLLTALGVNIAGGATRGAPEWAPDFGGVNSGAVERQAPNITYKLLWGISYFKDAYFLEEFKKLVAVYPHFSFTICLSRETNLDMIPEEDRKYFVLGRVTTELEPLFSETNTDFYICGKREVVEFLRQHLRDQKVNHDSIIFEKF